MTDVPDEVLQEAAIIAGLRSDPYNPHDPGIVAKFKRLWPREQERHLSALDALRKAREGK
jgi:hypothetical protein